MITAALCMSHSPLMDRERAPGEVEAGWSDAIGAAAAVPGWSAHELRCWIAALAALAGTERYSVKLAFCAPVTEWITGMTVLTASTGEP